jgi:hypothetical protein
VTLDGEGPARSDHSPCTGAGDPAEPPGMIVGMVSQIGGPEALEDLAVELALKVAELVEHIASDQHLPAADVADILFID